MKITLNYNINSFPELLSITKHHRNIQNPMTDNLKQPVIFKIAIPGHRTHIGASCPGRLRKVLCTFSVRPVS